MGTIKLFSAFPRVANILRTTTRVNRSRTGGKDQSFRGYIFIGLAATKRRTTICETSNIPRVCVGRVKILVPLVVAAIL